MHSHQIIGEPVYAIIDVIAKTGFNRIIWINHSRMTTFCHQYNIAGGTFLYKHHQVVYQYIK